jgi:anti-anti-sigma factor
VNEGLLKATLTAGDPVIIRLVGELDRSTCSMATSLLDEAIAIGKPIVVLDMIEVSFIDLSGLRALVEAQVRAGQGGVQLVLRTPSNRVLNMLLLSGNDHLFPLDLTDSTAAARTLIERRGPTANTDHLRII